MSGKRSSSGGAPPFRFRPVVEVLRGPAGADDLAEAFERLRARPGLCFLDGGVPREGGGDAARERYQLLAFDPLPLHGPTGLDELRAAARALAPEGAPDPERLPFFQGGFLGALAYDLGVAGEPLDLPPEPFGLPPVAGGLYVDFLVRDRARGRTLLCLGDEPGDGRPPVAERRAALLDELARPPTPQEVRPAGPLERHVPPDVHRARVERVRRLIEEGELYQANVSHRLTRLVEGDPVDLYLLLRRLHPAPYSGFLRFEGGALLSGSPELLLEHDPVRRLARTGPIKGTAARHDDPDEDARRARALLASDKDRAELAMIVDLERNDLGRVAVPGGVSVGEFPRLESYATVHHLVADVTAEVRPELDAWDVLAALFPTGSITGAPKLRSMEAIAEIEGEGRGFAYGALGLVDLSGRAALNVLIRTLVWRPRPDLGPGHGEVSLRVGGGITHASRAEAEELESMAKGEALLRVLGGETGDTSPTPRFPRPAGFPLMGSEGSTP